MKNTKIHYYDCFLPGDLFVFDRTTGVWLVRISALNPLNRLFVQNFTKIGRHLYVEENELKYVDKEIFGLFEEFKLNLKNGYYKIKLKNGDYITSMYPTMEAKV